MSTLPSIECIRRAIQVALVVSTASAVCQSPQTANTLPPPAHLTAEQDHQRTLDLLHITALRRGPDGDPKSPNAANFDESKSGRTPFLICYY